MNASEIAELYNNSLPLIFETVVEEELESINQLMISVWIISNFTGGSPEYSIVSNENMFNLAVNKILDPQRVSKFALFDGIRWNTITGTTQVSENKWQNLVAQVNETTAFLYVNGDLESTITLPEDFVLSDEMYNSTKINYGF